MSANRPGGPIIADTLQTEALNRPHRCAVISRQPVRLSGARQDSARINVNHAEMSRDEAGLGVMARGSRLWGL